MKALRSRRSTSTNGIHVFHHVNDEEDTVCGKTGKLFLIDTDNYPDDWWRWCKPCLEAKQRQQPTHAL